MNPVGDFPMQNLAKSDSAAGLHQAMMDSVRDASHQEH
jgi:hypothetical protein